MENIQLHDKQFRPFIKADAIDDAIRRIAERMNDALQGDTPLFLSILNGSFMFTSDLMKQITVPGTQISFVKMASYTGTRSSGNVQELIGLKEDITGRTVVILEDVIDSGRSMSHLLEYLRARNPRRIIVATLFYKPGALVCPVPVDYYGLELGNDFVVGRGLDYDGLGRNYPDLYILDEPKESE
ncbi:MAG: hypoxanthine phosphoribosyltransferase [Odoribacter sp.]|nr:hypoxanthine phosphoribosyltransferase [Odoribacter sp.]